MPVNPKTGKTIRRALTKAELFEFRTKQVVEKRHAAKVERGKQRAARNSPDAGKPEASTPVSSPSEPLTALGAPAPKRSRPSAAKTPADSPATFPAEPPLPEIPVPAPSKPPKARHASKCSGGKSASNLPWWLPLSIRQVSWLRRHPPHNLSTVNIGRPCHFAATHRERTIARKMLLELPGWRGG